MSNNHSESFIMRLDQAFLTEIDMGKIVYGGKKYSVGAKDPSGKRPIFGAGVHGPGSALVGYIQPDQSIKILGKETETETEPKIPSIKGIEVNWADPSDIKSKQGTFFPFSLEDTKCLSCLGQGSETSGGVKRICPECGGTGKIIKRAAKLAKALRQQGLDVKVRAARVPKYEQAPATM